MDILFEWGILSLVGLLIYGVLRVLAHSWRVAAKNSSSIYGSDSSDSGGSDSSDSGGSDSSSSD